MQCRQYFLSWSGLNFHCTEWGDARGWPIVMLHGIRGYGTTFAGVAAALQPDFRVIAPDQRGRGQSDWDAARNYYTDTYVADLEALVAALGLERFDLLGHSMGGINTLVYVAKHPGQVRRMVVEDAGPGAFEASAGAARIQRELADTPTHFASWQEASQFMRALRPTVTEAARQQRLAQMLQRLPDGRFTWRYDHAGISATRLAPDPARVVNATQLEQCVKAIGCATLVVRGARSDYLQPEMASRMCALNPRISALEIADAGHYIHDDQPELFNQAVAAFLRQEALV